MVDGLSPFELPQLHLDGLRYDGDGTIRVYVPDRPAPASNREGTPWSGTVMAMYGPTAGRRLVTLSGITRRLLGRYFEERWCAPAETPALLVSQRTHRAMAASSLYRSACLVGRGSPGVHVDALRCRLTAQAGGPVPGGLPAVMGSAFWQAVRTGDARRPEAVRARARRVAIAEAIISGDAATLVAFNPVEVAAGRRRLRRPPVARIAVLPRAASPRRAA
jgi:hypothetical protein